MRNPFVIALTVFIVIDALGWAFGVLPVLRYALIHKELPMTFGFRALSGPLEALGIDALIVAGILFVAGSLLRLLAAYWTWDLLMDGPVLQLILLAISALFWYGFALPFGPPVGLAQIVLLILTWKSFS